MSLRPGERILAAAIVFGALFVAIGAPFWWGQERQFAPKTGNYWLDVARPRERQLLTAFPNIIQRSDLKLTVQLASGGTKVFMDKKSAHEIACGAGEDESTDDCIIYHVWELSPDRRYITLSVGYFEGGGALLIDRRNGAQLGLPQPPHLAPDARHWAMVDEDEAYGSGGISVVESQGETLRVIASGTHDNCIFKAWETDSAFLIACYDFDQKKYAELRVTWDAADALTMTPTGRAISGEL